MIYIEDATRLAEAAANFLHVLGMLRDDQADADGRDVDSATVNAFARELIAQVNAVDGSDLIRLAIVRPELAQQVILLKWRTLESLTVADRPDWSVMSEADDLAIGAIQDATVGLAKEVKAQRKRGVAWVEV